jgi:hypothetical protein
MVLNALDGGMMMQNPPPFYWMVEPSSPGLRVIRPDEPKLRPLFSVFTITPGKPYLIAERYPDGSIGKIRELQSN